MKLFISDATLEEVRTPLGLLSCNITQANEEKYSHAEKSCQNDELTSLAASKFFLDLFRPKSIVLGVIF